ncbi:hypothetical protein Scep_022370 [Stephania cephalantha]|uniref:Uncharacterized protein n=1 Tax=Stephania cephalantha TaxID=152367 RepID=A0AAP0I241_9MAGN
MRERDEVLEKLRSKYFERISRGEGSAHDSLVLGFGEYIEEVYAAYEQHKLETLSFKKHVSYHGTTRKLQP